ncbi:MAG: hypothetical protein HQ557_10835 [Bacteroidetes bacterium]|nr:hypothetical protein [Bacteroidota bacterium]
MVQFKNDIGEAKQRVELWWNNERADRALIQVASPRDIPVFSLPASEAPTIHDYWTNSKYVIPRIINMLSNTWFGGESFPVLSPVSGRIVSITCKYLGAPNIYIDKETTWSLPIIDDWDQCPSLQMDPENEWWKLTQNLMQDCAEAIQKYDLECFMGLPDLNGPTEVLSGLRNPEKLCMDLIMVPDKVKEAAQKVQDAWYQSWKGTSEIANQFGGNFTWMGIWSKIKAIDLQSDFSTLISSEMFGEFVLPLLKEQTVLFPRTVFHLDGPDMVRHLDQLLALPELNAIQWIQGAGAGRTSEWLDLLRKIQNGGKSLYLYCESDEVEFLVKNLDSRGLMMVVNDCRSEDDARELIGVVEQFSRECPNC